MQCIAFPQKKLHFTSESDDIEERNPFIPQTGSNLQAQSNMSLTKARQVIKENSERFGFSPTQIQGLISATHKTFTPVTNEIRMSGSCLLVKKRSSLKINQTKVEKSGVNELHPLMISGSLLQCHKTVHNDLPRIGQANLKCEKYENSYKSDGKDYDFSVQPKTIIRRPSRTGSRRESFDSFPEASHPFPIKPIVPRPRRSSYMSDHFGYS
ncbi:hypothetical protein TRFO_23341 [Tritrichomonas foetus]|uniref:Uncharacterized protein n=1 Tax=Tritrichomonas foetus TaxID=1144522 RepID=A0A1J4KFS1_9EUKA|nr:hypothetical protein TRFO_23341 [Tritrichomonas foetus]|eukprot:OHT08197.1 hypothetical protein TRFO_23341 [Tritrichomonas foetus]